MCKNLMDYFKLCFIIYAVVLVATPVYSACNVGQITTWCTEYDIKVDGLADTVYNFGVIDIQGCQNSCMLMTECQCFTFFKSIFVMRFSEPSEPICKFYSEANSQLKTVFERGSSIHWYVCGLNALCHPNPGNLTTASAPTATSAVPQPTAKLQTTAANEPACSSSDITTWCSNRNTKIDRLADLVINFGIHDMEDCHLACLQKVTCRSVVFVEATRIYRASCKLYSLTYNQFTTVYQSGSTVEWYICGSQTTCNPANLSPEYLTTASEIAATTSLHQTTAIAKRTTRPQAATAISPVSARSQVMAKSPAVTVKSQREDNLQTTAKSQFPDKPQSSLDKGTSTSWMLIVIITLAILVSFLVALVLTCFIIFMRRRKPKKDSDSTSFQEINRAVSNPITSEDNDKHVDESSVDNSEVPVEKSPQILYEEINIITIDRNMVSSSTSLNNSPASSELTIDSAEYTSIVDDEHYQTVFNIDYVTETNPSAEMV